MAPHTFQPPIPHQSPGALRPPKEFVQFMRSLSAQRSQVSPGHHGIVQARLSRQRAREQRLAFGRLHDEFIGMLLGFQGFYMIR